LSKPSSFLALLLLSCFSFPSSFHQHSLPRPTIPPFLSLLCSLLRRGIVPVWLGRFPLFVACIPLKESKKKQWSSWSQKHSGSYSSKREQKTTH
jgi:hypothetical protein